MKIAVDGYEANVPQRLGSSQVAFELLRNLEKIDRENEYVILLPGPAREDLPKERAGWSYKILKPKSLWTRISLPLYLYTSKAKPDLIFSPTHYIPRFSPIKRVVTIFDLSFLHFPRSFLKRDLWQLTNWTRFSIQNANHIIAISNSTKQDIVSQYKVNKNKITVAYPGFDKNIWHPVDDKVNIAKVLKKYRIEDNFVVYIGTIQPRKNLTRLIEAFGRLVKESALQLVIAGKSSGKGREGWMYEDILELPKKLVIEERVKFSGFVPAEDLPYLLSASYALVQPSLWEGFGLSVVEAMACGVPVIVSNVSSLPEIVGKAGILVDPYSVDQIEQAIRTVVTDKKLRQKYAKAGLVQAQKFSWEKMAREVLKVFNQLSSAE